MPAEKTRPCKRCHADKPLAEFGRNSARPDGVHIYCRACSAELAREWRRANPEKVRARKRAYDKTPNGRDIKRRERKKNAAKYQAREKARRAAKGEEIREQQQRWRDRNRDHLRAYKREYQRDHPRPRAGAKHISPESIEMVPVLRSDPCSYCGSAAGEIDHIVAATSGGDNEWWNFTSACPLCNRTKNNRPLLIHLAANPIR